MQHIIRKNPLAHENTQAYTYTHAHTVHIHVCSGFIINKSNFKHTSYNAFH